MQMFHEWMAAMGFNRKQVREALGAVGIGYNTRRTPRFEAGELTQTELLAMSAARAGLKPWSPEYDSHLQNVKGVVEMAETSAL